MIDRLEELLEQVEEGEPGGESVLLGQLRPVSGPFAVGRMDAPAAEVTDAPRNSLTDREETERLKTDVGRAAEAPIVGKLTYTGAGSALPELYRQMSRAAEVGSAGRSASVAVVRETVPDTAAGLTAGELDLAMRRDSRRYDGGMTIY